MKIVIFTGAGAGKADGLPLQTELFRTFFELNDGVPQRASLVDDVASFFQEVFQVDPRADPASTLPTFEEALGILDLAISRDEVIGSVAAYGDVGELSAVRRSLVLALAATIVHDRDAADSVHGRLVAQLREANLLSDVVFVTTNYDTLLDEAIDAQAVVGDRGTGSLVNYGMGDLAPREGGPHAETRSFPCLKIHGSLNWLYCPACNQLDVTYTANGVIRILDEPDSARCHECETLRTPNIVPPSYYKNMSNLYLSLVSHRAYRALSEAEIVVFCGYSFPDADMHIKYAVKRAQEIRYGGAQPLRVRLVNHYPDKSDAQAAAEFDRFRRFLGPEVEDTRVSFEEFANNPSGILNG